MEDLTLHILFFANVIIGAFIALFIYKRLRWHRYYRILNQRYLHKLRNKELPLFYSTYATRRCLFKTFFKRNLTLSDNIALNALKNVNRATKSFALNTKDQYLPLLFAEIANLTHEQNLFQNLMAETKPSFFAPAVLKAWHRHLTAKINLFQTDMLSASINASQALKIYQKKGYRFEEAEVYLTLAQIYRISGVFDVAHTMLTEAEKIFSELKINAKLAETKAYFGLLEMGRENLDESYKYLTEAAAICQTANLTKTLTDIKNWQGLICFIKEDYTKAKELFSAVINTAATHENTAFAAEMLARVYVKLKDYHHALKSTEKALSIHNKAKCAAGTFENLYLMAQIYYEREKYKDSADILTALIKRQTPPHSTYYPANAYTLLGLINLKQNNLNAAETLFKQAVDLEHGENRLKAAVVDYNNLAVIARLKGDKDTAATYLNQALAYAQSINDNELADFIKAKID